MGCAELGDIVEAFGYTVPESRALDTVRAILDGPFNFLDTADEYGHGESERRIGVIIRERGGFPATSVLATKVSSHPESRDLSADHVLRTVEASLGRLGVSRVQLLYLHDPEYANQPFEEIVGLGGAARAIVRLRDEGVVEHIGIASGPIDVLLRYLRTELFDVVLTHNRFTLLDRSAEAVLDDALSRGVAVVNAAPFASGILAKGTVAHPRYVYRPATQTTIQRVDAIARACARHGVSLAAAALQFSLRDPRVASTIVGISRPERVIQAMELATHPIPDDLWAELDRLDGSVPLP
jgi:D-threo-aldose 1-dehydrogenase